MTAQLKQMMNPFANTTGDPKIPDGAVQLSLGQPYNIVTPIATNGNKLSILLCPGIYHYAFYAQNNVDGIIVNPEREMRVNIDALNAEAGFLETQAGGQPVNKWRVVSQGMKITCPNNSDTIQGWWEAIRVHPPWDGRGWELDPPLMGARNAIHPRTTSGANEGFDTIWAEAPILANSRTYQTGLVKDLHKHMFYLQHCNPTHDFQTMQYDDSTSSNEGQLAQMAYDSGMDWILLNIHTTGAIQLVCHIVQNLEFLPPTNDPLIPHLTECYNYPMAVNKLKRLLNSNIYPSRIINTNRKVIRPVMGRRTKYSRRSRTNNRSRRPTRMSMRRRR